MLWWLFVLLVNLLNVLVKHLQHLFQMYFIPKEDLIMAYNKFGGRNIIYKSTIAISNRVLDFNSKLYLFLLICTNILKSGIFVSRRL